MCGVVTQECELPARSPGRGAQSSIAPPTSRPVGRLKLRRAALNDVMERFKSTEKTLVLGSDEQRYREGWDRTFASEESDMEENKQVQEQPAPVSGKGDIWKLVFADMEARREQGIERYGVPLQIHNGRDALMDAYQEALDLVVYLRQAIEERAFCFPLRTIIVCPKCGKQSQMTSERGKKGWSCVWCGEEVEVTHE
jgi:hypothetical protein